MNMELAAQAAYAKALVIAQKISAEMSSSPAHEPVYTPSTPAAPIKPIVTEGSTKHARKVYVGGLPANHEGLNETAIQNFFNEQLGMLLPVKEPGDPVLSVYLGPARKYAFLELRSIPEATFTTKLDGMSYLGVQLKLRRPQDYNREMALAQAKVEAEENEAPGTLLYRYELNQGDDSAKDGGTAASLGIISTTVADGPNKVFIGGVPHHMTEHEIKHVLSQYGALKSFHLVKDKETQRSKGFAFCEWRDPEVTDVATAAINGISFGDRVLTCRRANPTKAATAQVDNGAAGNMLENKQSPKGDNAPLAITNGLSINTGEQQLPRYGLSGVLGHEAATGYVGGHLPSIGKYRNPTNHVAIAAADPIDFVSLDLFDEDVKPGSGQVGSASALDSSLYSLLTASHNDLHSYKMEYSNAMTILTSENLERRLGAPSRVVECRNAFHNKQNVEQITAIIKQAVEIVISNEIRSCEPGTGNNLIVSHRAMT